VARFVRDPDEAFEQERKRSFDNLRVVAVMVTAALAAAAAFAANEFRNDSLLPAVAAGSIVAFGLVCQLLLWLAEVRMNRERHRLQNVWMARRAELQELAGMDELTQLQNRRFFYEQIERELETAQRFKRPLAILMMDVDDLKLINDEFGHQVGDVVLRAFGRVMNREVGEQDITARIGGDEFAVIMPGADRRAADKLAGKIWEALSKEPICETEHASIYLGVSIGTGGYPWGGNTLDEIIHWADTKLYANKLERKGFKHEQDAKNDDTRLVGAVVDVLSSALEIRDRMTHRHAWRVARMSAYVAREMKMPDQQVLEVEYAAALHDIGKIGVADEILRKSSTLDHDEWQEMKRHCELGYEILKGIDFLATAADIVYAHHERWDGAGYPRGLHGEEIPLGARVFGVVDAFDAMTSRRPYREAMSREDALEEVMRNSGTQFDPQVVSAFLKMMRTNPDGFREQNDEYGSHVVMDEDGHPVANDHHHHRKQTAKSH
jgi:diguanylate cyclase (GGDEF)-like protein/putative nucleotidyltransferase with HDIG domain